MTLKELLVQIDKIIAQAKKTNDPYLLAIIDLKVYQTIYQAQSSFLNDPDT